MDVCLSNCLNTVCNGLMMDCLNTVCNGLMMEEKKLKREIVCCKSLIYLTRIWRNNHELGAAQLNRVRD